MIDLCLISPQAPPMGGIARWTEIVAMKISDDHRICLRQINTAPNKSPAKDRTIFDRVIFSGLSMFSILHKLIAMCNERKPDVIHITMAGGLGLIRDALIATIANKYHVPVVYHIHNGRTPNMISRSAIKQRQFQYIIRHSAASIAIDGPTYRFLTNYLSDNDLNCSLYYAPNPIEINGALDIKDIKQMNRICYIGWIIKEKGIEELLSAWSLISEKYPDWELDLIGPYNSRYHEYLEQTYKNQQVVFYGELDHDAAMDILSTSSMLVLPSYTEGFPNVLLEAMAFGKGIIATDVGAVSDILADNCGIIIRPQHVDELKSALMKLIENPSLAQSYGIRARNRCIEMYSLDKIYNMYFEIWNRAISKN